MADEKDDLAKAANLKGHVVKMSGLHKSHSQTMAAHHEAMAKLHKGCVDHHMKMAKLHKGHTEEMDGHFDKLHKMLGTEEDMKYGDDKPDSFDPQSGATPSELKQAAGDEMKKEDVAKIATEAATVAIAAAVPSIVDGVIKSVMAGLLGEERTAAALKVAATNVDAAKGVGDRSDLAPTKINKGVVVSKDNDGGVKTSQGSETINVDVNKVLSGDITSQLAFMKSAKPTEVPATLQDHVSKVTN